MVKGGSVLTALEVIFLDLDDTLYPRTNGLWQAIGGRILDFMAGRLDPMPASGLSQ